MVLNQILFVSGVMLTIGLQSSLQFFMKRSNYKVSPPLSRSPAPSPSLSPSHSSFAYVYLFGSPAGNNLFWSRLLPSCHRMAYTWNDFRDIWIHNTFQACWKLPPVIQFSAYNCFWLLIDLYVYAVVSGLH